MLRMHLCAGVAAAMLAVAFTAPATADDYPSKPIKIIVPTAPAGVGDIVARMIQQKFSELNPPVTVVVENRPGAAGVIGTSEVARAPADGYTFLLGNHAVLTMLPHLQTVPYEPLKGFAPVFLAVAVPNILVVHPSVSARSVKELVAYAKANPGKLSYASQGAGASGHIAGELFNLQEGTKIVHVPYKGAAPAAQDVAAGHVSMMFDVISLAMGPINAKKVIPLGVTTKQRASVLPDVPTMTEQGVPMEIGAWFGLLAPAGTPPAAVAWVARRVDELFATPAGGERFTKLGAAVPRLSTDAFAKFIQAESDRYGDVIRRAGIKIQQ
jgi:tripartite-type tricarboxylate transporter receptor subunit TctC